MSTSLKTLRYKLSCYTDGETYTERGIITESCINKQRCRVRIQTINSNEIDKYQLVLLLYNYFYVITKKKYNIKNFRNITINLYYINLNYFT